MSDLLIVAQSLQQALSRPDVVVLDVRYSLSDSKAGEQNYLDGHIPGARFLDQGTHLAGECTGTNGRHPLPDPDELDRVLWQAGLTPDSDVIVYDHNDGSFAARAWWLLRWRGYTRVRILDGGVQAWLDAGGQLDRAANPLWHDTPSVPEQNAGSVRNMQATMPTVTAADILTHEAGDTRAIVDARAAPRYRGETEPIDPVAGRIPDALNRPISSNTQPDGRFKPGPQLRDEFRALLGPRRGDQVIHYCGSGITACHNVFAMELAGLPGSALYPGSWSEWSSDPDRPVATG